MTIALSVTSPLLGLRAILARRDSGGSCLYVGYCSEIGQEFRAPDTPRWSSVLWHIVGGSGTPPYEGHAGPARQSAEEILAVLQTRVAKSGPWWLEEWAAGGGLQWGVCGPRRVVWEIAWQSKRAIEDNVRAWRLNTGRTGYLGHAETKREARAEALRIAALIRAGKKG